MRQFAISIVHLNSLLVLDFKDTQSTDYWSDCEQLVASLAHLPHSHILTAAITAQQDFICLLHPDEVHGVESIKVKAGHGPQQMVGEALDTQFRPYYNSVIAPQICSGEMTDGTQPGTYDDRKVRWSGAGVTGFWNRQGNQLTLEVGPTSYPRCCLDMHRHPVDALQLMLRGLQTHQDPYAYFARGLGVVVVPITTNGTVYIGQRSNTSTYHNRLNFVAGWVTFSTVLEQIDFYQDAQRELQEEARIQMSLHPQNTQFIGISGNPFTGEADLVFLVQTEVSDQHFQSKNWEEHSRWVGLHDQQEVKALLDQGKLPMDDATHSVIFSSRFALEYLAQNYW